MRRPERLYLQDILESCDAIQRFLNRTDEMAFMQDELIQSAILQKLGCEHELSGSRPPPCPTLKRRAESTKGAAAPSLVRVDAPRQPRASGASCAQRGRSRLRGRCAP